MSSIDQTLKSQSYSLTKKSGADCDGGCFSVEYKSFSRLYEETDIWYIRSQDPAEDHSCSCWRGCAMCCLLLTLTITNQNNAAEIAMDTVTALSQSKSLLEMRDSVHGDLFLGGLGSKFQSVKRCVCV